MAGSLLKITSLPHIISIDGGGGGLSAHTLLVSVPNNSAVILPACQQLIRKTVVRPRLGIYAKIY